LLTVFQNARKKKQTTQGHTSKRQANLKYNFCFEDAEVEVCKTFFLNTLSISKTTVKTAFKKCENGIVNDDDRGKTKHNDEEMNHRKDQLRQNILSFPLVPSHYCRSSSNLLYLSSELTLAKLYDLCKELCEQNQWQPLCYTTYWQVFQSMNISFHSTKKDRCETCKRYQNLDTDMQKDEAEIYQKHRQKANKIREIKNNLKQENDKTI